MRRYQNKLFASIAALALIAGTGWASAQTGGSMQGSGGMQGGQEHGTQSGSGSSGLHAQGQGAANGSAQGATSGAGNASGNAQVNGQANGQTGAQNGTEHNNRQARGHNERHNRRGMAHNQGTAHGQQKTAQQQPDNHMQGQGTGHGQQTGQANGVNGVARGEAQRGAGANVQLSSDQRTQIRQTVIEAHNAPRVGHVDFDVSVGTVVPRGRIHIVPVPETVVRIEPSWRGFLYFVYSDEVVVVNPNDMRIVAVLAA
jgi:Protein of unknown function (DUF1236)